MVLLQRKIDGRTLGAGNIFDGTALIRLVVCRMFTGICTSSVQSRFYAILLPSSKSICLQASNENKPIVLPNTLSTSRTEYFPPRTEAEDTNHTSPHQSSLHLPEATTFQRLAISALTTGMRASCAHAGKAFFKTPCCQCCGTHNPAIL